jgi:hypothetical protein
LGRAPAFGRRRGRFFFGGRLFGFCFLFGCGFFFGGGLGFGSPREGSLERAIRTDDQRAELGNRHEDLGGDVEEAQAP